MRFPSKSPGKSGGNQSPGTATIFVQTVLRGSVEEIARTTFPSLADESLYISGQIERRQHRRPPALSHVQEIVLNEINEAAELDIILALWLSSTLSSECESYFERRRWVLLPHEESDDRKWTCDKALHFITCLNQIDSPIKWTKIPGWKYRSTMTRSPNSSSENVRRPNARSLRVKSLQQSASIWEAAGGYLQSRASPPQNALPLPLLKVLWWSSKVTKETIICSW